MDERLENRKKFLVNTAYVCLCCAIYYVVFKYFAAAAWPFFIAVLVALFLRTPIRKLARALNLNHNVAAIIVVALFYVIIGVIIVLIVARIVVGIASWTADLPQLYVKYVEPYINNAIQVIETNLETLNQNNNFDFSHIGSSVSDALFDIISKVPGIAFSFAQSVAVKTPGAILGVVITLVASFFISTDYKNLRGFLYAQLDEEEAVIVRDSREYLASSISKMIVGYAIILCITFAECAVGLSILGIKNAIIISVIIAAFDILPIVGTGAIMVPWGIICFINGNVHDGIGLFVLFAVITVIRQVAEPKIVGEKIGLHPILMLLSLYLGVKIFGGIGLVILPFTIIVLKKLNDSGAIHIYNSIPPEGAEDDETDRGLPIVRREKTQAEVNDVQN